MSVLVSGTDPGLKHASLFGNSLYSTPKKSLYNLFLAERNATRNFNCFSLKAIKNQNFKLYFLMLSYTRGLYYKKCSCLKSARKYQNLDAILHGLVVMLSILGSGVRILALPKSFLSISHIPIAI
jgi:hypothetical protein